MACTTIVFWNSESLMSGGDADMRTFSFLVLPVLAISSLAEAQATPSANAPDSSSITLAAGTRIYAIAARAVETRSVRPGDTVYFQTVAPIFADGRVALPAGTDVLGTVESAARRGWIRPELELRLRASTFVFANGYVATGSLIESHGTVGDNGIHRDDGAVGTALTSSAVAGVILGGPVITAISAGVFITVLVHPTAVAMERGSPMQLVLQGPLTLDARRVADAARVRPGTRLVARVGRECFDPGSPGTPDVVIPGDPGTPAVGDMPGTPPTPPTMIPGTPGTPASWTRCP